MKTERPLNPEELALVQDNIALAQFLYHRYKDGFLKKAGYGVDSEELLSQAYYGLIRAALRYRPYGEENGYSEESIATGQYFSAFARKSIIGQMLDYLRRLDHVHSVVRKDYKALLEAGYGNSNKTEEELAIEVELTPDRVAKVIKLVHSKPVNLDDTLSGAEQTVGEQLAHDDTVESSALETSLRDALVKCIDDLPPKVQDIVYLRYYLNYGFPEIAEEVNESIPNVREMHNESLTLIHDAFVSRLFEA
jgi:RNA polymerase sigma factor (sigma-70 family)